MRKRILNTYRFLSEAHLVISFAAYCQTKLSQDFISITDKNRLPFFVGLITFIVYNFYSIYTAYFHPTNFEKHRITFWKKNRQLYLVLLLTVVGVTIYNFYFLLPIVLKFSLHHLAGFFILGVVSIFYGVPFYKNKSLRDLPFIKIFIISFIWAAMTVSFPLLSANNINQYLIVNTKYPIPYLLFLEKFLFVLAITLLCDVNDADWDKKGGVKTIPNFFGLDKTKFLIYFILSIVTCLDFYLYGENKRFLFSSIATLVITLSVTKNTEVKPASVFFKDGIDALLILQWLIIWVIGYLLLVIR